MKIDSHDEEIIDQLQKMPKIKDHKSKDELFQRISLQLNKKEPRKNNMKILMPMFGGLLAIAIIFIIVRPLIDQNGVLLDQATHYEENAVTESSAHDKEEIVSDRMFSPSYVVQEMDDESIIIYGAVSDDQLQTVIPISIILPQSTNVNESYNQMTTYLNESEWGVNDYLFSDVIFDINLSDKQVMMEFPESFSIGDGGANANMFGEVLSAMFTPLGIDKVVFHDKVDLGPIGEVTEFPLQEKAAINYKVYQASEYQRKFLVPVTLESEITIESAIKDLKNSHTEFNVQATIPESLELSLSSSGEELLITFENQYDLIDEEDAILMIESILMTAKSFDYELVTFIDTEIDIIGSYDLSRAIPVPKAINPVYIND